MDRALIALALLALVAALIAGGRLFVASRRRRVLARERELVRREREQFAVDGVVADSADRVLFFSTATCVQCHELQAPALERLRTKWPRPLVVERVDAIERDDLAKRYGVLTVPSTVVFAGGEPRAVNYGYATAETIARQLAGDAYTI